MLLRAPRSTLFPYTTLFRSARRDGNTHRKSDPVDSYRRLVRQADGGRVARRGARADRAGDLRLPDVVERAAFARRVERSEEHTSELQSQFHLVCRLLLEKKN